jgi:hypothetical protein
MFRPESRRSTRRISIARARAPRSGGIVSQFVPMPFLDASFHRVLRTFLAVFPASTLWYNTSELLLIESTAIACRSIRRVSRGS